MHQRTGAKGGELLWRGPDMPGTRVKMEPHMRLVLTMMPIVCRRPVKKARQAVEKLEHSGRVASGAHTAHRKWKRRRTSKRRPALVLGPVQSLRSQRSRRAWIRNPHN